MEGVARMDSATAATPSSERTVPNTMPVSDMWRHEWHVTLWVTSSHTVSDMLWSLCGWHELHQLMSTFDTSRVIPSTCVTGVLCRCNGVHERWLLHGIWLQQWAFQRLLCLSIRVLWEVLWNRYVVLDQRSACTNVCIFLWCVMCDVSLHPWCLCMQT